MTHKEILARSHDPSFLAAVRAWAASEMTQVMLEMAEISLSARRLPAARAEDALVHSGYGDGGRDVIKFLQEFGETVEAEEKRRAAAASLTATYGAGEPPKKKE